MPSSSPPLRARAARVRPRAIARIGACVIEPIMCVVIVAIRPRRRALKRCAVGNHVGASQGFRNYVGDGTLARASIVIHTPQSSLREIERHEFTRTFSRARVVVRTVASSTGTHARSRKTVTHRRIGTSDFRGSRDER
jgi:hypothetical protein